MSKIRTLFISGNHPRHLYYFNALTPYVDLVGLVMQTRENLIPDPPRNIPDRDRLNWTKHFVGRQQAEAVAFGKQAPPATNTMVVENIQHPGIPAYVAGHAPELVLVFGVGMIRDPLYSTLPRDTYNLHLGLSPRYRGAATLFWPFYMLEPNYAGCTFHRILAEPDAGEILHQCKPDLWPGDGVHDVATRAVKVASEEMAELLQSRNEGRAWNHRKQTATGKNFLARDFQPAHLRTIYDVYNNNLVDEYLEGNLAPQEPTLYQENLIDARFGA